MRGTMDEETAKLWGKAFAKIPQSRKKKTFPRRRPKRKNVKAVSPKPTRPLAVFSDKERTDILKRFLYGKEKYRGVLLLLTKIPDMIDLAERSCLPVDTIKQVYKGYKDKARPNVKGD